MPDLYLLYLPNNALGIGGRAVRDLNTGTERGSIDGDLCFPARINDRMVRGTFPPAMVQENSTETNHWHALAVPTGTGRSIYHIVYAKRASASASSSATCVGLSEPRIVTVGSTISTFLQVESISRITLTACGAHEPFSTNATRRF